MYTFENMVAKRAQLRNGQQVVVFKKYDSLKAVKNALTENEGVYFTFPFVMLQCGNSVWYEATVWDSKRSYYVEARELDGHWCIEIE